jgi:hypothetical protein
VEPPTLADVRDAVAGLDRAYHLDDYAMTLAGLPLLIAEARSAVAETEGDAQAEALALLDGAAAAAVRIGDRVPAASLSPGPATIGAFCRTTVEWKRVESAVISGHPDRALALSREAPRSNRPTSYNRNRHLLDVAAAHAQTGAYSEATAVLLDLRDHAPAWLRHQRYARDIVGTITSARRKAMSQELADLATLVGTDL